MERQLKGFGIRSRRNASNGLWLTYLLPGALMYGCSKFKTPVTYCSMTACCSGMACVFTIMILILKMNKKDTISSFHPLFIIPAVVTSLTLYNIGTDRFSCLASGFLVYIYNSLVIKVMKSFPLSFTYGEASIVTQAFSLLFLSTVSNVIRSYHISPNSEIDIITLILQVGMCGGCLICMCCISIPKLHGTLNFYMTFSFVLLGIVVPLLQILIQENPILWILEFLSNKTVRIFSLFYCFVCTILTVISVNIQIRGKKIASSNTRKIFHVFGLAVFLPGILWDPLFLYLASGVAFAVCLILELMLCLNIPPLAESLKSAFAVFADNKDEGRVPLTPLYLLAGFSFPLWLYPEIGRDTNLLPLLAGILSVGIGDSLASMFGTTFGTHIWTVLGSSKSFEGTVASIVGQLLFIQMLIYLGYVNKSPFTIWFAVLANSLIEAKTSQIDNLVLPLITYLLTL